MRVKQNGLKYTHDDFLLKIESYGLNVEVISEYKNNKTKVDLRFIDCGHERTMSPSHISRLKSCPTCRKKEVTRNQTESADSVNEKMNEFGFEMCNLEEYKNSKSKVLVRHKECGYEWTTTPSLIYNSQKINCPNCIGVTRRSHEQFCKEVIELTKNEYEVIGLFSVMNSKVEIKHNSCGNIWSVNANSFLNRNARCPICVKKKNGVLKRKTHSEFLEEVFEMTNGEYEVLGKYVTSNRKVLMKHNTCGNEWLVIPNNFTSKNRRCPKCKRSRGEERVESTLIEMNIKYESQYRFDDCRNIKPLPFDFALLDENNNVKCLVEYDGEFHYRAMVGEENFQYVKMCDSIKNEYCEKNNIKLIRIPYWEYDHIEEILSNKLEMVYA